MLTLRQVKLTVYLLNNEDWVNSTDISEQFNLDRKTLRNELNSVSEYFGDEISIISTRQGYRIEYISDKAKEQFIKIIEMYGNNSCLPYRPSEIMLYLLFLKNYISMQELADRFYMSKTAVALTVQTVKRWIERSRNIKLEISRNKGIKVIADEKVKREYCARFGSLNTFKKIPIADEIVQRYTTILLIVRKIIPPLLTSTGYILTGEGYKELTRYISCSVLRSEMGIMIDAYSKDAYDADLIERLRVAIRINTGYVLDENEISAVWGMITKGSFLSFPDDFFSSTRNIINDKIPDMEHYISSYLSISDFSFDDKVLLSDTLCLIVKRSKYGIAAVNNHWNDLVKMHPLETYLMDVLVEKTYGIKANNETAYIAQILYESLCKYKKGFRILLVSDLSRTLIYSIKKLLNNCMSNYNHSIEVVPGYIYKQNIDITDRYDILLTTEADILLMNSHFHIIPPVMADFNEDDLRKTVRDLLVKKKEQIYEHLSETFPVRYIETQGGNKITLEKNEIGYALNSSFLLSMYVGDCPTSIVKYTYAQPCEFKRKQIKGMLRVSIHAADKLILDFFDFIPILLKENQ
ncbi:MAG: helix-turn-helix domain-containing protein [Butyrivibrio sp.]|nr:helix-turn-helix domain-containing protein [Butyrivibrio sp.]